MQTVTAEQVKETAIGAGVDSVQLGQCEVCEEFNQFAISSDRLYRASNCTCVDSVWVEAPWQDAANWINLQPEASKIELMRQFGFDVGEEPEEQEAKFYINTTFMGHYPVGCAAVIRANSIEEAAKLLNEELERSCLQGNIGVNEITCLSDIKENGAIILADGNY